MVAHSQTNPPLLLHPPLPTLNFQLSIRFPAPHSYLPSPHFYSSTFPLLRPFLFPFQSFIPNPPLFLSYIFRSTPIFFCSLSLSFPAFSSLKSLVPLKIHNLFSFYLFHSPFFWSLLRAKTFHSISSPSTPLSFSFSIIFIPTTISLLFNRFKM